MWTHEYVADTGLAPEDLWEVLSDVNDWVSWDTSLEEITIHGPFAVGTTITMTLKGGQPVRSAIVEIEPKRRYADETEFGGLTLRFSHDLRPREGGGTRVIHRLAISGAEADTAGPEVGPQITEDFPDAMAALLAHAARRAAMR